MSKEYRVNRFNRRKQSRLQKFRRDGRRVWGNSQWVANWDGYGPEGRARRAASLLEAHTEEMNAAVMAA